MQSMDEVVLDLLRTEIAHSPVPAVVAGVADTHSIRGAAAIGSPVYGQPGTITPESRFHLGSITKSMTATALATMVEAGDLTWTARPADLFPELRSQIHPMLSEVQLHHLLTHRAGIQPFEEDDELAEVGPFPGTPQEQRAHFTTFLLQREPAVTPLVDYQYSNAGYTIATAMAERATGMPWEMFMADHLLGPLGLESAGIGWPARHGRNEPWGHVKSSAGWSPQSPDGSYHLDPLIAPAGDLHMNLIDLLRFGQMHLRGLRGEDTLIRAETVRFLHTPIGSYALGWNEREGIASHSGSAGTFFAVIVLRPQVERVHACMINGWEEARDDAIPVHVALATEVLRGLRERTR